MRDGGSPRPAILPRGPNAPWAGWACWSFTEFQCAKVPRMRSLLLGAITQKLYKGEFGEAYKGWVCGPYDLAVWPAADPSVGPKVTKFYRQRHPKGCGVPEQACAGT